MIRPFLEVIRQIHGGEGHEFIEVAPDPDGTGMVEIRLRSPNGEAIISRVCFPTGMAHMVASAVATCADEVDRSNDEGGDEGGSV